MAHTRHIITKRDCACCGLAPSADAASNPTRDSEYAEFRYAQLDGLPSLPSQADLAGWRTEYPFDGNLNEDPLNAATESAASPLTTAFRSSDPDLDRVFGLAKYTITAASLDVNTDSNTRQRDVCTWVCHPTTQRQI